MGVLYLAFCSVVSNKRTKQLNLKQICVLHLSFFFSFFTVYCLNVMQLEKKASPENSYVVFCRNKQLSF